MTAPPPGVTPLSTASPYPDRDELLALWSHDLESLRTRADALREVTAGSIVRYNVNRHIEPTNICRFACTFCSFARHRITETGAFRYSVAEIIDRTAGDDARGITEYHIVGGVDLDLGLDYYVSLIAGLRSAHPKILIKALSAVEIGDLARRSKTTYADVLEQFRDAGAQAITGGGAEIFSRRVRKRISATKIDGEQWLEIHATAHRVGLRSNATMLFGHLENTEERTDHILAVRDLQEKTRGFGAFIPLPFIPFSDTRLSHLPGPTREDYLRTMAISRIALTNFGTIKAYWPAAGIENARESLRYGANDLDGTITEETIYHTNTSPLTQVSLEEEIRAVGRVPVER